MEAHNNRPKWQNNCIVKAVKCNLFLPLDNVFFFFLNDFAHYVPTNSSLSVIPIFIFYLWTFSSEELSALSCLYFKELMCEIDKFLQTWFLELNSFGKMWSG